MQVRAVLSNALEISLDHVGLLMHTEKHEQLLDNYNNLENYPTSFEKKQYVKNLEIKYPAD